MTSRGTIHRPRETMPPMPALRVHAAPDPRRRPQSLRSGHDEEARVRIPRLRARLWPRRSARRRGCRVKPASSASILRTRLRNGLLVLLKEIHTAPLVSTWIWYRVGSRDEAPGRTGISHWTEHMQFKGTPSFPAGLLDRAISRDGGLWNAFTWIAWTGDFWGMPAHPPPLAPRLAAGCLTP